ncbi:MAG: hypothetical protein AAF849_17720 [Bacteroidota bacterium]
MLAQKEQNHEEALEYFKKAFKVKTHENCADLFHAAKSALALEKNSLAKRYIINAIKYTAPKRSYYDNFFSSYKNKQPIIDISNEFDNYKQFHYENFIPKSVYDELDELIKRDQSVRLEDELSIDKMKEVDNYNMNRLIKLTQTYGWLDRGWLLLWHQRSGYGYNNHFWKYFKPLIDGEIKSGKVEKGFWASFEDNLHLQNKGKQKYGTYSNIEIDDVQNVD